MSGIDCVYMTKAEQLEGWDYRQSTFVATMTNCRWSVGRAPVDSTTGTHQTIEFIVWPVAEPAHQGPLFDIDHNEALVWGVMPGETFTVRLGEKDHAEGFAWNAPAHNFVCATVAEDPSTVTGWKQYFVTANTVDCTETFTLNRASWWTAAPFSRQITLNVGSAQPDACVDPTPFFDGFTCVAALPVGEIRDVPDADDYVRIALDRAQVVTLKEFAQTPGS
jgi:hypothetical protein